MKTIGKLNEFWYMKLPTATQQIIGIEMLATTDAFVVCIYLHGEIFFLSSSIKTVPPKHPTSSNSQDSL
jgi:hypothetical protein